ncbi:LmbU family transcriptional regulator [Saccharopolyspora erythraea]|uniref:LmbU family transcriptional regulator n=1 Tax=Saccharopolyspora erythraea TaxID=1836 RepID=UPI0022B22DC3|nr:LmbU family transcriptional regulator [Saccharopolyspora erythraea]
MRDRDHGSRLTNGDSRSLDSGREKRVERSGEVLATQVGLQFPHSLPFEDWERAGKKITRIVNSSAWFLGDWVVYGQARYSDRYRRAIETARLDYQTIRNYAWVARRFELSRRRDKLSFQHHAEVAALPVDQQDRWLDRAEEAGWSRNQLRQHIRNSRLAVQGAGSVERAMPAIQVTSERLERWQRAAERAGSSIESWIVANLDSAAGRVLEEADQPPRQVEAPRQTEHPPRQVEQQHRQLVARA